MLSCKDFVLQSAKILDNEELSFSQRLSNKFHIIICHHCRRYLKQAQITISVANKLVSEQVSDQTAEVAVSNMKTFTINNSQ